MKTKIHIPARPTVYKGIRMRSRLEADFASALDRDGRAWEYEPTCFAGPDGQWLPDFKAESPLEYIEVKPAEPLIAWDTPELGGVFDRVDEILQRISVAWLSEPDAHLSLVLWKYGCEQVEAPLSIAAAGRRRIWHVYTPSTLDVPMLWPGMGQTDAIADCLVREQPAAAKGK